MNGWYLSSIDVDQPLNQSKKFSIPRWMPLFAILVAMTVLLLTTDSVTAQLSPRGQIILDVLGLDKNTFRGRIKETKNSTFHILTIVGVQKVRVNGKDILIPIRALIDLEEFKFQDEEDLRLQSIPDSTGKGASGSGDGSCVVGHLDSGPNTPFHAFRWTAATGAVDLGTLDTPNNASLSSFATDTSDDCSVVVGLSDITGGATQHAFRTANGGMVDLTIPSGGGPNSRAFGVSSDGAVVVGDADFPAGAFTRKGAFRWTGGSFTDLIPGTTPSLATAVSADGTVVVGQVGTTTASSAFRWTTQNPTMQPIGPLSGHATAAAIAVSDNGKIVAGISNPAFLQYQGPVLGWNTGTAFRWTQAKGTQDLQQVLVDAGANIPTDITLVSVTGMSPDGQWIQGDATQAGSTATMPFVAQVCDDDIGGSCSTSGGGASFTIGAAPSQLNVSAGQSGTTIITVTPNAGFAQPVSFSCGGLPVGAACAFNPASVTPAGGPVNTTLTISTNGGAVALLSPTSASAMFTYALAPFALLPIGMLLRRRGSDRRLLSIAVEFIATLTLLGMLSCSGGSDSSSPPPTTNSGGSPPATGTPAGTSNVTVTATSGSSSSGVPVTLNVTRP